MNTNWENPAKPILTMFISYSVRDRHLVTPIIDGLREVNVEVLDFFDSEPLGADIGSWVETNVAEADCVAVVISDNSLSHRDWIEREMGLALRLLAEHGTLYPAIVPIRFGDKKDDETIRFQPRNFHTGEPAGQPIVWKNINCMMPERDSVEATVDRILKLLTPRTVLITDPQGRSQSHLFDSAMQLYRELLPNERERDSEVDIVDWLYESWEENGQPDDSFPWLNVLAIQHIGGKVIGIFWCNIHRSTGIGFISFWGVLAAHRSYSRSITFANDVIGMIRQIEPATHSLLFAAERVDWDVLDKFLNDALLIWKRATGRRGNEPDRYLKLAEPLDDQPSALTQALNATSEKRRLAVIEQLRRFRRFTLYTNGAKYHRAFERQGIELLAFARRGADRDPHRRLLSPMAEFVQPPIRPPVDPTSDCHLWLFILTFGGQRLSPAEAVDWIYDVFLKESFGMGRFELPGWNDYMVEFKRLWRDRFVEQAELRHLRPRDWLAPYNLLLTEVKKYWLRQQALGHALGRWDIHL